jgi:hypothetical protein
MIKWSVFLFQFLMVLGLYFGHVILLETFSDFSQSLQVTASIVLRIRANPFQFIIEQSSYSTTIHILCN